MKWWWSLMALFCEWRAHAALSRAEANKARFDVWKKRAWGYQARI